MRHETTFSVRLMTGLIRATNKVDHGTIDMTSVPDRQNITTTDITLSARISAIKGTNKQISTNIVFSLYTGQDQDLHVTLTKEAVHTTIEKSPSYPTFYFNRTTSMSRLDSNLSLPTSRVITAVTRVDVYSYMCLNFKPSPP